MGLFSATYQFTIYHMISPKLYRNLIYISCLTALSISFFKPETASAVEAQLKDTSYLSNKKQVLLKGNGSDPQDLDPQITVGVSESNIHLALFEGLINFDPKNLSPIPGVATSWEISPDSRTYTFHLRPDAQWSNGQLVTADDFVFAYQRILSPALGSEYASMLYVIKGAEAFHKSKSANFSNTVQVRAIDKHTLIIELENPCSYFLSMLTHHAFFPVHPETILKFGSMDQRNTKWTQFPNHVSNGPFKLKRWSVGEVVEVERNNYYWNAAQTQLTEIHFFPFTDPNAEQRAFETGQLHITDSVPPSKFATLAKRQDPTLKVDPYLATYYYCFNTQRAPFNDIRVCQALNLATDRSLIAEKVAGCGKLPATTFTPPNLKSYTCNTTIPYAIDKARELLAEAGFPNGKGFPKIELLYNNTETNRILAQAIQEMWKQALNIEIELVHQEWKVYLQSRKNKQFDILRASWIADYADPSCFLALFKSDATNNHTGWANSEYDHLLDLSNQCLDATERNAILSKAESILLEELPILPIYFFTSTCRLSPKVKGWYPNLLDMHPYQYMSIDPL
jgi:oligopeptide transport system substrate-binding protein